MAATLVSLTWRQKEASGVKEEEGGSPSPGLWGNEVRPALVRNSGVRKTKAECAGLRLKPQLGSVLLRLQGRGSGSPPYP